MRYANSHVTGHVIIIIIKGLGFYVSEKTFFNLSIFLSVAFITHFANCSYYECIFG